MCVHILATMTIIDFAREAAAAARDESRAAWRGQAIRRANRSARGTPACRGRDVRPPPKQMYPLLFGVFGLRALSYCLGLRVLGF